MDSPEFSTQRALEAAVDAASQAGLDSRDARVCRVRSSIHVELPRARVAARVEVPGSEAVASRLVRVARFWEERDAPVARLVRPEMQPLASCGGAVTLWRWLRAEGAVSAFELGRTARILHDLGRHELPHDLPRLEPTARVREWIHRPVAWIREPDRLVLMERLNDLERWWRDEGASDPLGFVLLHGDVHRENSLATHKGVVLLDLEDAGVGPVSWEFAPFAVGVRRYGLPNEMLLRFCAGYGEDPRSWVGFDRMCELYELEVVVWALHCGERSRSLAREAAIRLDGFLGRGSKDWTML
jgi:hypothetical protein